MPRIDALLKGCPTCQESCEDSEATCCKVCGTRLTAGAVCFCCGKFRDDPDSIDGTGKCQQCREDGR